MKAGLPNKKTEIKSLRPFSCRAQKLFPAVFLLLSLLIIPKSLWAFSNPTGAESKLEIADVSLVEQDSANNRVKVQFSIRWENSWRNQVNWDAAWIFIKYTTETAAPYTWKHATLYKESSGAGTSSETNHSSYSRGSGTTLDITVVDDTTGSAGGTNGAFLYRSDIGYGQVLTTDLKFVWDYGQDGVSDVAVATVRVYGIEMVYIPQGSFYIGDSTDSSSNPPGGFVDGGSGVYGAVTITSENIITGMGAASSGKIQSRSGMAAQDDFSSAATKSLPGNFPKGYASFYVMKYEITQSQYAAMLNTLDRTQQVRRVASTISADTIANKYVMSAESLASRSNRNYLIAASVSGLGSILPVTFTAQRGSRAMNYMSWMDLAAFADWAALRPMNELEYEKIARGDLSTSVKYPKRGEYAWGSSYLSATTSISVVGLSGEDGAEKAGDGNANYGNVSFTSGALGDDGTGPLRSGIYAAGSAKATRELSGAGFYGVMELSGNVAEQVVNIGNTTSGLIIGGRAFTNTHGNGILESGSLCTAAGNAVGNATWPGYDTSGSIDENCLGASGPTVALPYGSMRRGGGWSDVSMRLRISDRYDSSSVGGVTRGSANGGRLVRKI